MNNKRNRTPEEMRMVAEDAAIKYLAEGFSPQIAAATATTVEMLLAIRWREEFLSWSEDDPRMVFVPTEDRMREIRKAFTEFPRGLSDPRGEQHVFDLLRDFPLDWAWNVARLVREYLVHKWQAIAHRPDGWPTGTEGNLGPAGPKPFVTQRSAAPITEI